MRQLLGRADNLSDYVRRGQSSCWTQITLSAGGGPKAPRDHVVRREIELKSRRDENNQLKRSYESNWYINGE
jgi:hypothetical protein